jgi:predicted house-cleaning noncanonical NTP pyrophosphatase (MazG superfamily)
MANSKVSTTTEKKAVDWAVIEKDYRAGVKSNRQMADEHSISETAIRKRAAKYEWKKDLANKIRERAKELVRTQEVRTEVRTEQDVAEDAEIIETNAKMQADVVISHRKDIQRTRSLAAKLLSEVEHVTDNQDLFEQLGELLIDTSPRENGKVDQNEFKRMEALNRVLDMSGRIDSCKKLSETLKTLIGLEREAFSIDEKTQTEMTLEDYLEKIDQ